ncbi:hypothetical protein KFE25_004722 [Diacronema lutheri]|mgnify:CR=1 FL=1|uniref:Uncharacterized protein n=1 Tax=Diacronema lutheri TaxID=2081491 RepID=A0A8J5X7B9_DIALT|nr:hypothetical protein KFE25_004722 [Diacronema lutheri]
MEGRDDAGRGTEVRDDAAKEAYMDACRELQDAIGSLESALVSFTGKEEGIKGRVFARTRERLDSELSTGEFPWELPEQPRARPARGVRPDE